MKKIKIFVFHICVIAFALLMLYPLLWVISSSFKTDIEIFQGVKFLPEVFQGENYLTGWSGLSGVTFARFFLNSFTLSLLNIIGNVFSCGLAAYAFAKREFRFKKALFAIMLGTMMLPIHVTLIPQYVIFNKIGWVNTFLPLTVPSFFGVNGFFIFMMTQFMRAIPREIDEAAEIDGCSPVIHYLKIILPMSLPAIITTCIFTFIWTWNDFFSQMIYITDIKLFPVSLALRQFVDTTGNSSWGALFAMSTLSMLPLFLIFVFLQKYLIEGVTAGSVKG